MEATGESGVSSATRQIFHALDHDGSNTVSVPFFYDYLERCGLLGDDPRLAQMRATIGDATELNLVQFAEAIASASTLINRAVTGTLRVPDFERFAKELGEVYAEVLPNKSGANADYIPQLARVDPEQFAISVTTVDGQHFSIGDADEQFCIQSCSKPISYLLALAQFGDQYVHRHVGTEPSGRAFNDMSLKDAPVEGHPNRKIPHNPCINAGAIMAVSMLFPEIASRPERLEKTLEVWRRLSGKTAPVGYDDGTYKSESATADRNWCLGYMMKESKAFPECFTNLEDTLELYFQVCSILNSCRGMSMMAATLANGGLNPVTGDRIFSSDHVRSVLPIMMMAGMYDYSGQWVYDIGAPAKSGVGGCVFVVIPNVCGISIWSPRLDAVGNSARGVAAATAMTRRFQFHTFEVFSGLSRTKMDVKLSKNEARVAVMKSVMFAASEGDEAGLKTQFSEGVDPWVSDYDDRTPLHLASSEGHLSVVKLFVELAGGDTAKLMLRDRWGGTALSDARQKGHAECAAVLEAAGCTHTGKVVPHSLAHDETVVADTAPDVLLAASEGDVDELVRLSATGHSMADHDYDRRSPLHLAACQGQVAAAKYILSRLGAAGDEAKALKDRFGNTPVDDAIMSGHDEMVQLLQSAHLPSAL